MPRVRQKADAYAEADFWKSVEHSRVELGIQTYVELADRTGMAKKTINEIIKGKAPITPDTALKLEHVFGLPAHFWNMLQQNFQETKARLAEQDRLKADLDWLRRFPVGESWPSLSARSLNEVRP